MALFYSLNMIAFLIVGDLNGAKYLWKRAPELLKSSTFHFAAIWNVGKLMWSDDVAGALNSLKFTWPHNLQVFTKALTSELTRQQLETFSAAFSVVPLATVSNSLALSKEETIEGRCLGCFWI